MYIMNYTRSGIAYAIIKFSRCTSNPNYEQLDGSDLGIQMPDENY